MNIILAHNHFHTTGGAEVFYKETGRILEENGHKVAYFSPKDEGIDSEWEPYFPASVDYKSGGWKSVFKFHKMIRSREARLNFEKLILDFKPDVVHVFAIYIRLTPSLLVSCKKHNIPVIISCNDYKLICPNYKLFQNGAICEACKGKKFYHAVKNKCSYNSYKYSIANALESYFNTAFYRKHINLFLFASNFMAKKTEEFWGAGSFKWGILKNPFDSPKFPKIDVSQVEDYILYFGRLIDEKGVDVLIRSMKDCPKVKLKVVGTGPDEELLRTLAKKLDLTNVDFLGPLWGDELDQLICKSRFVIIPSVWHENYPYVILQSFAHSKAVIGSEVGGIPELIKNEVTGLLYPSGNSKILAEKINFLFDNKELSIILGENAKKYADEHFNDSAFYTNLINIYKTVVN